MVTKSKQKPVLASQNQARASAQTSREVSSSWSPPRRLLSRLVAFVSSDRPPAPPASGSRAADRGPAQGGQRPRSSRRAVTGPTARPASLGPPSAQARGVSGALHLRRVRSQARRGRTAVLLASESPDSRFPTRTIAGVEVSSRVVRGFERV